MKAKQKALHRGARHTLANTEAKREAFIKALRECGIVSVSCRAAGVGKSTVYRWRRKWASFAEEWDDALDEALDAIEMVAREMALDKDRYMIALLLKAHRPETYDRQKSEQTTVDVDMESGKATVTIARVAPGFVDSLLSDAPVGEEGDDEDAESEDNDD